jgi:hypothetical protein
MAADVIQAQKQEFRIMRLYIQLVPKRDYLSFERTPRPEEVQEDPTEQIQKLEHAFIARFGRSDQADKICGRDSPSSPRRMAALA